MTILTAFSTCDLCDAHKGDDSGAFRVLPPVFPSFGGLAAFAGLVTTVKCFEDNSLVKAALDSPGNVVMLSIHQSAARLNLRLECVELGVIRVQHVPRPHRRDFAARLHAIGIRGRYSIWRTPSISS